MHNTTFPAQVLPVFYLSIPPFSLLLHTHLFSLDWSRCKQKVGGLTTSLSPHLIGRTENSLFSHPLHTHQQTIYLLEQNSGRPFVPSYQVFTTHSHNLFVGSPYLHVPKTIILSRARGEVYSGVFM